MKSCFKQIDKNGNVWYKHICLEDHRWVNLKSFNDDLDSAVMKEYRKYILDEPTFSDDNGKNYYLMDICDIGFDDEGNISTLYVLGTKEESIIVTNQTEVEKLKNYLDNNNCNKK